MNDGQGGIEELSLHAEVVVNKVAKLVIRMTSISTDRIKTTFETFDLSPTRSRNPKCHRRWIVGILIAVISLLVLISFKDASNARQYFHN
jgi:hypothetical protein